MTIEIHEEAKEEIEAAARYLNRRSPGLGDRFLSELADRLEAVERNPFRFSKLETLPDDHSFRRALVGVFRYAVIFETLDARVVVFAVTHTSHEPNYWLDRRTR